MTARRLSQLQKLAGTRPYTIAEILSCGCEPEIERCGHCDGRRRANTKREEAIRLLHEARQGGIGLPGEALG